MPSWPGSTATMPPPTPLLAGMPTALTQSPAASYMPQVTITDSVRFTTAASVTLPARHGVHAATRQRGRHPRQVGRR